MASLITQHMPTSSNNLRTMFAASGGARTSSARAARTRTLRALVLLFVTVVGGLADASAFGAIRYSGRSSRSGRTSYRSTRMTRPNPMSGAATAVQRAQAALNSARAEQAAATRNLVSANSTAKTRYDNSASRDPVREEFQKAEATHDAAKDEVLAKLRQNSAEYKAAQAKLKDAETRLKSSSDSALKAETRQLRLDVSKIESLAFAKDSAVQAAQQKRDEASARMLALRRDSEKSIVQDSSLNQAKANSAKAVTKVQQASANYSRAVASANAAANAARAAAAAQAMRGRVVGSGRYGRSSRGWGHRGSSSRFRRYR